MAWTIAVVLATLGLSGVLLLLNNAFEKSKSAIKVFFIMLTLGTLVLLAQIIKLIINDKATGTTLAGLQSLSTVTLTVSIVLLSFFTAFFLVLYTRDIVRAVRDSKKNKEEDPLGDF